VERVLFEDQIVQPLDASEEELGKAQAHVEATFAHLSAPKQPMKVDINEEVCGCLAPKMDVMTIQHT